MPSFSGINNFRIKAINSSLLSRTQTGNVSMRSFDFCLKCMMIPGLILTLVFPLWNKNTIAAQRKIRANIIFREDFEKDLNGNPDPTYTSAETKLAAIEALSNGLTPAYVYSTSQLMDGKYYMLDLPTIETYYRNEDDRIEGWVCNMRMYEVG